ncbi:alpha-ribazole phosphatase [Fodinibius salsisoli]|uniref:Alpha-ribazole phosphatase n=1 Tax=Fodinibius salsisoli TaxID=2820877 RepID=A0ABT3PQB8_9BACT|nr:alpha-ribazole phosphatase [Fodinibius salsisoli]MCW9708063.1 alpha-ribazole phosphatase [Fodinibius salsisoli]
MDLFLIRHTTPDIEEGICYGQKDIDLADSFPDELKKLGAKLPENYPDFPIHSSPLKRCRELAQQLAKQQVTTDSRLKELDFGAWEGRAWDDIDPEQLQPWMQNFVEVACPGGESYRQLYDRAVDWWQEVIQLEHKQVLVISHSGVIRCIISHILEVPLKNSFRLSIDYGSVTKVSGQQNRNIIHYINR